MEAHVPVLLPEILGLLEQYLPSRNASYMVDATLGGGGHSEALLENFPYLRIIGLDRDSIAMDNAVLRLEKFGKRLTAVHANFDMLEERARFLKEENGGCAIGVLFDFGVSNMQLSAPERGFSFQDDGPLDMRMNQESGDLTAADIIRTYDRDELTGIFRAFGEERYAFRLANAVIYARDRGEVPDTTAKLVALIRRSLPAAVQRKMGGNPARRVFQALRIEVNSELEAIPKGLRGALELTENEGFIIAISYHSLEDRIVKRTFREWESGGKGLIWAKRPIVPSESEINSNRKARSAKMRVFIVKGN